MKRRGLLAALGALAAMIVGKVTEAPLSAGTDGDVVLGTTNNSTDVTYIVNTNTQTSNAGFGVQCIGRPSSSAIIATGGFYGVNSRSQGGAAGNTAVFGESAGNDGYGVHGSGGVSGVRGTTFNGAGVQGESWTGNGVLGLIPSYAGPPGFTTAVYGLNASPYTGPGPGAGGFGVYGLSVKGHGLVGATATAGAAAVVGATNGVAGAYAGAFYGPVIVGGDFTVVGGAKSAAVPHPDGSHRRLYCLESPESWFEDFGSGQLSCGRAEVKVDPDFAALVDLSDYHVYLTEQGTHYHVALTQRTAAGFTVEADAELAALKGRALSELNGTFSWRVVAKRKDIDGERLATVAIPTAPMLPEAPPPARPMPELSRRQVR